MGVLTQFTRSSYDQDIDDICRGLNALRSHLGPDADVTTSRAQTTARIGNALFAISGGVEQRADIEALIRMSKRRIL
jgi:hypothetical protein